MLSTNLKVPLKLHHMAPGPEQMLNKFCWMNKVKEDMQITFTDGAGLKLMTVIVDDKSNS